MSCEAVRRLQNRVHRGQLPFSLRQFVLLPMFSGQTVSSCALRDSEVIEITTLNCLDSGGQSAPLPPESLPTGTRTPFEGIMKRFLTLLLIVTGSLAYADNSKIAPELQGYTGSQQVQVIVQYTSGTRLNCSGLLGLVACVVDDIVNLAGKVLGQLPLINGLVAQLDSNGIQNLSNQSNVVYISPDRSLTPSDENANGAVNAEFAWQSTFV